MGKNQGRKSSARLWEGADLSRVIGTLGCRLSMVIKEVRESAASGVLNEHKVVRLSHQQPWKL